MKISRIDAISRSLALRSSRRNAMLGGAAAAAGVSHVEAQGDVVECTLAFTATVVEGDSQDDSWEGDLTIEIDLDGNIDTGTLVSADNESYGVVGFAKGRTISLRIDLGQDGVLTLHGAADLDIELCRGEVSGSFAGPQMGDLGTWSAETTPIWSVKP